MHTLSYCVILNSHVFWSLRARCLQSSLRDNNHGPCYTWNVVGAQKCHFGIVQLNKKGTIHAINTFSDILFLDILLSPSV